MNRWLYLALLSVSILIASGCVVRIDDVNPKEGQPYQKFFCLWRLP